ncbi:DUF2723 domain-containing protein [bacterium]|nr:DUF2723 domain-containing protein [candidate division CSSED10-310 bacterium]
MNNRSLIAALLFLVVLSLYMTGLAPTIALIDSSEFITAAHCLGNAHSPGYPTFSLLGKAFDLLPLNCIPFRINLMSAVFAAVSALLLFAVLARRYHPLAAVAGAGCFALSGTLWEVAETAEVYSAAMAALALVIWLLARGADRSRDCRWVVAGAFILGLGLGLHQMLLFVLPALGYLTWRLYRNAFNSIPRLLLIPLFGVLGFSVQLQLPLRAAAGAAYAWEMPDNAARLLNLMTTATYHGQRFVRSVQALDYALGNYAEVITSDLHPVILVLSMLGVLWLVCRREPFGLFLLLMWFLETTVVVTLFNIPPEWLFFVNVFYLPGTLALALGFGAFWGELHRYRSYFVPAGLIILLLWLPGRGAPRDKSDYFLVYDWAVDVMNSVPNGGLLITQQDEPFALAYVQLVERYRPDVTAIHFRGFSAESGWYRDLLRRRDPSLMLPFVPAGSYGFKQVDLLRRGLAMLSTENDRPCSLTAYEPRLRDTFFIHPEGAVYTIEPRTAPQSRYHASRRYLHLRTRGLDWDRPDYEHADRELLAAYATIIRENLVYHGTPLPPGGKLDQFLRRCYDYDWM